MTREKKSWGIRSTIGTRSTSPAELNLAKNVCTLPRLSEMLSERDIRVRGKSLEARLVSKILAKPSLVLNDPRSRTRSCTKWSRASPSQSLGRGPENLMENGIATSSDGIAIRVSELLIRSDSATKRNQRIALAGVLTRVVAEEIEQFPSKGMCY
jgi:hypothetical protein